MVDDPNNNFIRVTEACAVIGGTKPIDPSTYYRGVKVGIYPAPDRIGRQAVRVNKRKLLVALGREAS